MKHKIRSCFWTVLIGAQVSNQGNNLCFADGGSRRKGLEEKAWNSESKKQKKIKELIRMSWICPKIVLGTRELMGPSVGGGR